MSPRLALLEANNFHEETLFAFASALERLDGLKAQVFAPEHWRSREFLREELGANWEWRPFSDFGAQTGRFDLLLVNTYPSPAGRAAVERAQAAGTPALGLVHDIDFFAQGGALAALERHERLWLAHAGPVPPEGVDELPPALRARVTRFFPVVQVPYAANGEALGRRAGVALPGALEYARRDFSTALRLTAETGIPLRVFGRSRDHGDGPKRPRDLNAERDRLFGEIDSRGVAGTVEITTDVSCRDFYRAVDRSRFVAVMTVNPEYLRGKLTGAVTGALSCGVPMLALPDVQAHYAAAEPDLFPGCMLAFDPLAPPGGNGDWASIASMPAGDYARSAAAAIRARDTLVEQNARTITRALSSGVAP